jgi:STE24 endopeptidase
MKKTFILFLLGFVAYALAMWWYLFIAADQTIPQQFKGTVADPKTFMTDRQLELTYDFSRIKQYLYFLSIPFEWGIYLLVLGFGLSRWFRNMSEGVTKYFIIHTVMFVILLSFLSFILSFPVDYYSYTISQEFNVSVQSFSDWMRDNMISFWINFLFTSLTVFVIYYFIRRNEKRWWFYAWLISIPFTIFMFFIQPVIIDPLYNDFYPLKDKQLEEKILDIASRADIPAERVYEVNMSEKTNAMNAYVNGIGSNLRIVLWDTTLNKLEDDEVLFIMAHEMGHYVKNHLLWNLVSSIGMSFLGLWIGSRIYRWMINRWGDKWNVNGIGDIAGLPALLLIFSLLTFAVSPASNAISRNAEHSADVYAIEMTKDSKAAIGSFQKLAVSGLSDVNPPALVKFFLYGHPTLLERMIFLDQYGTDQ